MSIPSEPAARAVAVTGGGTAGHANVALAVACELRDNQGCRSVFLGRAGELEETFAHRAGVEFFAFPALPVEREPWISKLRSILLLPRAVLRCRGLLRQQNVGALFASGGFVSVAPVLAARTLGLEIYLHEANAEIGLANRFSRRFADRLLLTWPKEAGSADRHFGNNGDPVDIVGCPLSADIEAFADHQPEARTDSEPAATRLLVMAGSEGSSFLNSRLPGLLSSTAPRTPLEIRHFTGAGAIDETRRAYQSVLLPARVDSFDQDIVAHYRWADLVVTGAGALTLAELCCLGKPCFLVPVSGLAADHQEANATEVARGWHGPTFWTREDCFDSDTLAAFVRDRELRSRLSLHLSTRSIPGARRNIADLLWRSIETRRDRAPEQATGGDREAAVKPGIAP
jgi:UDP-N-acetylglucosamine--N-acetylmuramyl-(pentapeptide) pyrophosphoryl-undecaprenol N-acetylglucosamine transferase